MEKAETLSGDNQIKPNRKHKLETDVLDEDESTNNEKAEDVLEEPPAKLPRVDGVITYDKVELYAPMTGPKIYDVKGSNITPPLIAKNLPEAFKFLPVFGKPNSKDDLEKFYTCKIREFVGCGLNNEEFNKLANTCSPNHLKTGNELKMTTNFPTHVPLAAMRDDISVDDGPGDSLCIVKKLKLRISKDMKNLFVRSLKYRGIRILPPPADDSSDSKATIQPLQPGKDIIFKVRVYRPFLYSIKDRLNTRHSIFNNDIVLSGRQTLADLRDRIVCANDAGMRIDMSKDPDEIPNSTAKELFPSGFLFINNVFYVDERPGCRDISVPTRAWAAERGLGEFPRLDLSVRLDSLQVRLGHPEVYVHQGACEHLFTFSEARLAGADEAVRPIPPHNSVAQNQTLYCTTCAEFGARWAVVGCNRVPFDPAFFCDTCLRLYLYKDGQKLCDFKAYHFRGNEINILKPQM